jgi:TolB-like protein/cytochrome c-type biogenesis protein CcmH/NrfG
MVTGAVFLSYASEDAAAAERICANLRAADIEVWFDQTELRGGDAWDRQIRKQIHDCALFVPIISAHSQGRLEGYFRREWKLAADRTHDMAEEKAFLMPVVIDDTSERLASVPDKFHDVQWTHLPAGETSAAFVERVRRLLSPNPAHARTDVSSPAAATPHMAAAPLQAAPSPAASRRSIAGPLLITLAVAIVGYLLVDKFFLSKRPTVSAQTEASAAQGGVSAHGTMPEKSIAVLPFADLSEKHDQEYFADGMAEEIIDRLVKLPELRVTARASSFYFRGKTAKVDEIARQLGVANVLEGSVRKAGNRLRVTTQLVHADNGYQVWSETYDRELQDVFVLQDQIATAVAGALRITLAGVPLNSERGGTRNLEAYQCYLRGKTGIYENSEQSLRVAKAELEKAVNIDAGFGLAYSRLAQVALLTTNNGSLPSREGYERTRTLAKHALEISPELAEPHLWLGYVYRTVDWNWSASAAEFDRVLRDNPSNVDALMFIGILGKTLGRWSDGERSLRAGLALDPLNTFVLYNLGDLLYLSRRYPEAEAVFKRLLGTTPNFQWTRPRLAMTLLVEGRPEEALAVLEPAGRKLAFDVWPAVLLANGRTSEADAALQQLATDHAATSAYYVAVNFAYRNEKEFALQWIERAYIQRESSLASEIKGEPLIDSIRDDPRFQALLRKLDTAQ